MKERRPFVVTMEMLSAGSLSAVMVKVVSASNVSVLSANWT